MPLDPFSPVKKKLDGLIGAEAEEEYENHDLSNVKRIIVFDYVKYRRILFLIFKFIHNVR